MQPTCTSQKISAPDSWSELPGGSYYRAALEQQLQPWWPKMFGFHLLKIGMLSVEINTEKCSISHQVNVAPQGCDVHVLADPYQQPFAAKSVDACLLSHTLAYTENPYRVLREVDRILIDDGWLILSTFNLFSWLGIGKLLPGVGKRQPYASRMFTQIRLFDWLNLLNYEVIHQARFCVLPGCMPGGQTLEKHLPALGCMGVIVARKRTLPLTPTALKFGARKLKLNRAVGTIKSYRDHS